MKTKVSLLLLIWLTSFGQGHGQSHNFTHKQKLDGISGTWHTLVLENDVFINSAPDLGDLRILGVNKNNDTLEAPYILKIITDETVKNEVSFNTINQTSDGKQYTFEIPHLEEINQINLGFKEKNFDWRITLEGSQDLNEWLGILQDYRILSIKNATTEYKFTDLTFPAAKFKYFRLSITSDKAPQLLKATLSKNELKPGKYRDYRLKSFKVTENAAARQTILDIRLSQYVPISVIKLDIEKQFDFYRPVKVQCVVDSVKGPDGWNYTYQNVHYGMLSSMENNKITLNQPKAATIKVIIDNQDNTLLAINSVEVQGNLYELTARFLEQADYYLHYGNENLSQPDYDISYFEDKIPANLTTLITGPVELIPQAPNPTIQPLFANKMWLWGLMLIIIALLGWFSLKMIKN